MGPAHFELLIRNRRHRAMWNIGKDGIGAEACKESQDGIGLSAD
jgi:hypothetical protein